MIDSRCHQCVARHGTDVRAILLRSCYPQLSHAGTRVLSREKLPPGHSQSLLFPALCFPTDEGMRACFKYIIKTNFLKLETAL